MKNQLSPKQIIFIIALIVVAVIGAYLGFLTYQYKVVARGILSLLVLYLVFHIAWQIRGEKINALFIFPKGIKYYIFGFFCAWFFIWALGFIVEMIIFLMD